MFYVIFLLIPHLPDPQTNFFNEYFTLGSVFPQSLPSSGTNSIHWSWEMLWYLCWSRGLLHETKGWNRNPELSRKNQGGAIQLMDNQVNE